MSIFWKLEEINLGMVISEVDLGMTVTETLEHYDPLVGIDTMAIGSTFEVA